jgi:hypothetical protein
LVAKEVKNIHDPTIMKTKHPIRTGPVGNLNPFFAFFVMLLSNLATFLSATRLDVVYNTIQQVTSNTTKSPNVQVTNNEQHLLSHRHTIE